MLYYIFLREIQIEPQKTEWIWTSEILIKRVVKWSHTVAKDYFLVQQFYFAVGFFSGSKWIG